MMRMIKTFAIEWICFNLMISREAKSQPKLPQWLRDKRSEKNSRKEGNNLKPRRRICNINRSCRDKSNNNRTRKTSLKQTKLITINKTKMTTKISSVQKTSKNNRILLILRNKQLTLSSQTTAKMKVTAQANTKTLKAKANTTTMKSTTTTTTPKTQTDRNC